MKRVPNEGLSTIKFYLYQAKKRIIIWSSMIAVFSLLSILSICYGLIDLLSFLPAFLLLGVYITLLIVDIRKYRAYRKKKREFVCNEIAGIEKLETFLTSDVKTKLIQGHDVSITDQFGNYLVFFRMDNEWLMEIKFMDEEVPTYHEFSFDEYSKNTNWLTKRKGKKTEWIEVIKKLQSSGNITRND